MIGAIIVKIAFAATIAAMAFYYLSYRRGSEELLRLARTFYLTAAAGILAVAGVLLEAILNHRFEYYYVWNYSSTDLPLSLLISTLYAGQEGSFLLWGMFTAVIGIFLMRYSSRKGYEKELMTVYAAILACLVLMLVVKNPFKFIWEQFPGELLKAGEAPPAGMNFMWVDQARGLWSQIPVEGKGLNALLQNYWMVIHPPILFIGFTSMSIPFAYAVAAMLKRDYVSWIRVATPWTVFGSLALGTGIILGGYWAYETLGWGGYWGWDPVENSSLVPWLVCVASIHTMLAQRKNGSYIKTNFVLSLFCFILVLYSTFLTRSGVLGETSVHSFVDPGMWVYWLLLAIITAFGALGFGLLFHRWKEMPVVPVEHTLLSREFALFLGAATLVFASIFILIGTSSPIITNIIKGKTSAVDPSFYVTTTLPLGVALALLAGLGQLLWWQRSDMPTLLRSLRIPVLLSVLFTAVTAFLGATHPAMIIFIFASAFALFANLIVGYGIVQGNPRLAGGAVTHIGIALMFLGFVASAKYDDVATVNLVQGRPVSALGYTMTYTGYKPQERGRFAFSVEVEKDGRSFVVAPVMFRENDEGGLIRNPDIVNLLTKDFYVSPLSLEAGEQAEADQVTVTESAPVSAGGFTFRYLGYEFAQSAEGGNVVRAKIEVESGGKREVVVPVMNNRRGEVSFETATHSSGMTLTIARMNPVKEKDRSSVTLVVGGVHIHREAEAPAPDTLVVEASVKPFINLVWIGTGFLIIGFVITIVRRWQEALRNAAWK